MIKKLLDLSRAHMSFVLIVLGAGCFFLANIIFKSILTDRSYGQYSIIITYFSIIYIFGLMGLEQIFLRYSGSKEGKVISTQKFQFRLITGVIFLSSITATIFFKLHFDEVIVNPILLYFSSLSMIAMLYLFNIFRLNADFVLAQLVSNFWRLILLVFAGILYYFGIDDLVLLLNTFMLSIILIFVCSLLYCLKSVRFSFNENYSNKEIVITALQFLISITTFSLLTFGDRFVIEYKFGVEEFGNYFYLTNFFLAPFSILQNYVGFKQLVFFKSHFTIQLFDSLNRKFLLLGVALGIFLIGICYAMTSFNVLDFKFNEYIIVILLLIVLGIVRLYSASINAAFEARTTINSLQRANIIFIILSMLIILTTITLFSGLESIVGATILIWFIRCSIWKYLLVKQIKRYA